MNVEQDKYNYGIAVLKIWMCFEVVLFHFKTWTVQPDSVNGVFGIIQYVAWYFKDMAVPVFMLLAFILTDISRLVQNKSSRRKRIFRLTVPVLFWAVVYYVVIYIIDKANGTNTLHGVSDVIWQIVAGHVYNKTLWFQTLLIIITALFSFIIWAGKSRIGLLICICLGVCCLFLQYAGATLPFKQIRWPNSICGEYFTGSYVVNTIGRFFEMVPYASLGMIMCNRMNTQIDKKFNYLLLLGSGLAIIFFLSFKVFISIDGFYYQGLEKMTVAFVLVVFFYMMRFGRFPRIIKKTVRAIANHVMAVYYMHRLVGLILYNTSLSSLLNMRKGSFYDCFLIFLISIILAMLGSKIPVRVLKESFS